MTGIRFRVRIVFLLLLWCTMSSAGSREDSLKSSLGDIGRYYKWHPQGSRTQEDKFKFTPLYGIAYTQEIGLLGMGGFNGRYRGTGNPAVQYSNISVSCAVSTKLYILTAVSGIWYSPYTETWTENLEIRYGMAARYMPERFYGIGYAFGQMGNYGTFRQTSLDISADFLFRIRYFKIGPSIGFECFRLDKFEDIEPLKEYSDTYWSPVAGLIMEFDTKDDKTSPRKGVFLKFDNYLRPAFGGPTGFRSIVTADFFIPLWKGGCLAADLYGDFSTAESHWMNWGLFGGENRMRGYYTGRYRDRNNVSAQLELRQWFTPMHGAVLFGGAGTVFHDFASFDLAHLLPTYGAGYRLNLFGMLIRLDVGFGSSGQWAINAGFNQAF